ncbi:MAG: helix-turn-helix domain-containing protein [Candidatus Paceibacteria bacterium]
MKFFNKKEIQKTDNIGDEMKRLRERAGYDIREMEEITKLERDHILAIESSAFHKLPEGGVYKKLFIKRYLSAFDVDKRKYLKKIEEYIHQDDEYFASKPGFLFDKNIPLMIKASVLTIVVGFLLGYIGIQVEEILQPPPLTLSAPSESFSTSKDKISIRGKTGKEVMLSINGKKISHNTKGMFEKEIELNEGLNTIIIKAKKEHGKTTTKIRHVVKKQKQRFSLKNKNKEI